MERDEATAIDFSEAHSRVLVLPPKWKEIRSAFPGQVTYMRKSGLAVIITASEKLDGRMWKHVSMSRQRSVPDYRDMCEVKEIFIGRDKKAIQVFPPESEHVNIHPNCLHLWHCMTEDPLPDFTEGMGTI